MNKRQKEYMKIGKEILADLLDDCKNCDLESYQEGVIEAQRIKLERAKAFANTQKILNGEKYE